MGAAGVGESYRKAAQADQGGDDVPRFLRKLWIPCRQSWAEDSVWGPSPPCRPGLGASAGAWAAAATGTQARGAACPVTTAPGS